MYKERFNKTKEFILKKRYRLIIFTIVYKYLPIVNIVAYPLLLLYLLFTKDERLLKCILIPLFMFVTLSGARYIINLERPYEKYDIEPIFFKNKKGRSFPSRHTGSAVMIALVFWYICPPLGACLFVVALLIGVSRVVGGVHFPRDVLCGAVYALVCGGFLFFSSSFF